MTDQIKTFEHRGVMLDLARLLEKREYYYGLMPWLQKWGYNILHFHFSDDTGCAVRLPSHPELSKPNAFSVGEMKAFISKASEYGLTVIPELESLGHTQFITSHPDYKHLGGITSANSSFNSLHPDKKECRNLLRELLKDICDIFPSEIIHVGLDEVDMSGLKEFKDLDRIAQQNLFANHAIWMHQQVRDLGRRPAMWGDHILKTPEMAELFEKDVLIFDWHYNGNFNPSSLDLFIEKGFEVWGCPASVQWNDKLIPSVHNQFQNIREFSACCLERKSKGCTGMVNTVWCPWRYLSGVMDLPMAFAGHLFSNMEESESFVENFCSDFYGLNHEDSKKCAAAIWQLHKLGKTRELHGKLISGMVNDAKPILNREEKRICTKMESDAIKAISALRPLVAKAQLNSNRLNDYILTGQMIETLARLGANDFKPEFIGEVDLLLEELDKSWNQTKDEAWDNDAYPYTGTEWPLRVFKTLSLIKAAK